LIVKTTRTATYDTMRALLALAALGGANAFAPSPQPPATLVRRHGIKVKVEVDIPALWDGAKEAAYKVGDLAGAVAGSGGEQSAKPPADPLAAASAKINATVASVAETAESIQRFPSDVEAKAAATVESVAKTIDTVQALPGRVAETVDETVDGAKRTAARIKSIPSRVQSSVDETARSITDAVDFVADLPARAQRTADGVTKTVTQTVETVEKTASAVAAAPANLQASVTRTAETVEKTASAVAAAPANLQASVAQTAETVEKAASATNSFLGAVKGAAKEIAAYKPEDGAKATEEMLAKADAIAAGKAPTAATAPTEKPAPASKAPAAAPSPPKAADAAADAVALATRLRDAVVDVDNAAYGDKIAASFLASLVFLGVVIPTSPFTAPPPVPTTKREKRAAYVAAELNARKNAPRPIAVDD
jgi:uncharacterized protein Yka (UPF0111/DUF47 family)